MTSEWNAAEYHKVSDPQFAWGQAVLQRLELGGGEHVIDVGCGSGRLTRELAARLPQGRLIGLDASDAMLQQARTHLGGSVPSVPLVRASLPRMPFANWADVVFSTATFHWVPDHPALFASIFAALKPGGRLHAQCGGAGNLVQARKPAEEVMALSQFAPYFAGWHSVWEFADDRVTAARLSSAGFRDITTNLEPAPIVFDNERDYRAFVSVVIFRIHLSKLPSELQTRFLDEMVARVSALPQRFTLDYCRLNMQATRPVDIG
jgi:trans-aconitate methyltransferase